MATTMARQESNQRRVAQGSRALSSRWRAWTLGVLALLAACQEAESGFGAELPMSIVAGNGSAGFRDGGDGQFNKPIRLAPFGPGAVLVADIYNHALRLVTRQGWVTTLVGGPDRKGYRNGPAPQARLASPHGVAVSASGLIAVAEAENHTIRLLTPRLGGDPTEATTYTVSTLAGVAGQAGLRDGPADQALFSSPHAVVWLEGGGLLVADIGNARLRLVEAGEVRTVAGAPQPEAGADAVSPWEFTYPMDLALGRADGSVLVADAGSHEILRWSETEGVQPLVGKGVLDTPHGVAADDSGRVFVAEMGRHRVVAVDGGDQIETVCGTGTAGAAEGELNRPAAVMVHSGEIWVADLDNHRIVTCSPVGEGGGEVVAPDDESTVDRSEEKR